MLPRRARMRTIRLYATADSRTSTQVTLIRLRGEDFVAALLAGLFEYPPSFIATARTL